MRFQSIFRFLLLSALAPSLHAAPEPEEAKPSASETSLNLGYNMTRGTQDSMLLELGGNSKHPWGDHTLTLSASYAYGETQNDDEDITTQDTTTAKIRYDFLIQDPWFAYLDTEGLRDELALIDYRLTTGPGVGLQIVKTDDVELVAEIGGAWVSQKVDGESTGDFAARFGQRLSWKLSPSASLTQSVEYLRKFNDVDEDLINARITVESILTGNLSLRLDLKNRYESRPAEGSDSNTLTFTAGVAVKL